MKFFLEKSELKLSNAAFTLRKTYVKTFAVSRNFSKTKNFVSVKKVTNCLVGNKTVDRQNNPNNFFATEVWNTNFMRCAIWHHLYNLKNIENTHGRVLLLVKLQVKRL